MTPKLHSMITPTVTNTTHDQHIMVMGPNDSVAYLSLPKESEITQDEAARVAERFRKARKNSRKNRHR